MGPDNKPIAAMIPPGSAEETITSGYIKKYY
jgi:hypothetical protein